VNVLFSFALFILQNGVEMCTILDLGRMCQQSQTCRITIRSRIGLVDFALQ